MLSLGPCHEDKIYRNKEKYQSLKKLYKNFLVVLSFFLNCVLKNIFGLSKQNIVLVECWKLVNIVYLCYTG